MATVRLYHMVAIHFCVAGGEAERFRIPAVSRREAETVTRILFNRRHHRVEEAYVKMRLDRVEPLPPPIPPVTVRKREDATPYLPGCLP